MKKSWKQVSEADFKMVKALQEAGLSISKASDVTGRAWGTIQYMYTSDTLAQYKARVTAAKKPKVTIQKREGFKQIGVDASQVNQLPRPTHTDLQLQRIAKALERMADAWEAQPKRTGLFK